MTKSKAYEILKRKLRNPHTIFLLGAGASSCAGLPGVNELTELIHSQLHPKNRSTFEEISQALTANGIENPNIEEILSEICYRLNSLVLSSHKKEGVQDTFDMICQCIHNTLKVDSPTDYHKEFVSRIVSRREAEPAKKAPPVQIFTTNYDLLIELACEELHMVAINGFEGVFRRCWNPKCFDYDIGKATEHAQTPRFEPSSRHIRLYKLHGSLSWFEDKGIFYETKPGPRSIRKPLIIYPSRLKYAQSIQPPFDWLLRRFGDAISKAQLLVCIGYGFADEHLNQYIFAGLNNGLSLIALSKEQIRALASKSNHHRVSIITEESTIIDGNNQNEIIDLWAFEKFARWLPSLH